MCKAVYMKIVLCFFPLFLGICSNDKIFDNNELSNNNEGTQVYKKYDISRTCANIPKRSERTIQSERYTGKIDTGKETLQSIRMPMSFF